MKRIILSLVILFLAHEIFAQSYEGKNNSIPLGFGIMGGINSSKYMGTTFFIEGRINLIPKLNAKMSIGYSTLYKKGYHVNTNGFISLEGNNQYVTDSYDIDRFKYSTI